MDFKSKIFSCYSLIIEKPQPAKLVGAFVLYLVINGKRDLNIVKSGSAHASGGGGLVEKVSASRLSC
jgi:hypothetical protein